ITGAVGAEVLRCNYSSLPTTNPPTAGGVTPPSVHVTSGTTKDSCATIDNTANVTSTNDGSGTSSATVIVQCPNVSVLKTADTPSTVSAGSTVGFTISTRNAGPGTATGVVTTDNLPGNAGLDWSIASQSLGGATGGSTPVCAISGPVGTEVLTCSYSSLPTTNPPTAGGAVAPSVHITSGTTKDSCGTISNTANV